MKSLIALFSSSLLLCSCADMYVTNSRVGGATSSAAIDTKDYASAGIHMTSCGIGAHDPKAIYIRPFCIDTATFIGDEAASDGEMPIRKALTPVSFATTLKESLEKLAPARVLKDDERPRTGWLVEGEFTMVDGGSPLGRFFAGHFGAGRSYLAMHVRVTDVETGTLAYEFDVAGGSRLQGHAGTIRASGLGKATPFDLVNAAERIYLALEPNAFRYGSRTSLALR
ncbi:MAG: DUF4410 domain-containing protein [Verrucomicrobiota bacterium]|nr:DUF4410 domain-containing protein [Verrucomicrobiota bacterium]